MAGTAELDTSELPEGVSHLLVADDVVTVEYWEGSPAHVAVCGAVVDTVTAMDDPGYCLACVAEAVRWNTRSAAR